ncbi:MAG: hypothetical protein Q4P24_15170 [Rhodobacterales bacterium]|nr:hypothetical protein [Rhodobacterales bacterium]
MIDAEGNAGQAINGDIAICVRNKPRGFDADITQFLCIGLQTPIGKADKPADQAGFGAVDMRFKVKLLLVYLALRISDRQRAE